MRLWYHGTVGSGRAFHYSARRCFAALTLTARTWAGGYCLRVAFWAFREPGVAFRCLRRCGGVGNISRFHLRTSHHQAAACLHTACPVLTWLWACWSHTYTTTPTLPAFLHPPYTGTFGSHTHTTQPATVHTHRGTPSTLCKTHTTLTPAYGWVLHTCTCLTCTHLPSHLPCPLCPTPVPCGGFPFEDCSPTVALHLDSLWTILFGDVDSGS